MNKKSAFLRVLLTVLIAWSLAFNIFIITVLEIRDKESLKELIVCHELLEALKDLTVEVPEDEITYPENNQTSGTTGSTTPETQPNTNNPTTNNPTTGTTTQTNKVVLNESNIKITYIDQEDGLVGPELRFYIENNSNRPIDVSLTNVYIDDFQADLSGGYVYGLEAGRKTYQNLTLWESDWENFTTSPTKVEFVIRVYDPDIWNPIIETDYITIYR